jgi:hypothetical protein
VIERFAERIAAWKHKDLRKLEQTAEEINGKIRGTTMLKRVFNNGFMRLLFAVDIRRRAVEVDLLRGIARVVGLVYFVEIAYANIFGNELSGPTWDQVVDVFTWYGYDLFVMLNKEINRKLAAHQP